MGEIDRPVVSAPRPLRGWTAVFLMVCGDLVALLGALCISLMLRFDHTPFHEVIRTYLGHHLPNLPLVLLCYIALFWKFRLYRYVWRFAGLGTLRGVVCANTIGLAAMIAIQLLWEGSTLPRSVLIVFWMTSIALVGGVRICLRLANLGRSYGWLAISLLRRDLQPTRIVILGSAANGARLLELLREGKREPYKVIGILDDRQKPGTCVRDVCVLGPVDHLYELLEKNAVDEVLIALPDAPGRAVREYVIACRGRQVAVKVIPGIREVLSGKRPTQIEEFSVEDLLRRPPVCTDMEAVARHLQGKRILVTGAGGSIGSELCRQIAGFEPSKLILLGHGENSIHQIYVELTTRIPKIKDAIEIVIASVADSTRIDQVFNQYRPEVVFHAAAHKHVPIMENNALEAVQNNVIGTYNVAEACGRYGATDMVLISTDKAVYPVSILGATKRMGEEMLRAMVSAFPQTGYVAVRFGNVLGSRGSVVPLFHAQIKRGGPVTVTHEDMTRHFMLIPEAVQLVLQAGAIGRSGELFVLEMGGPVKIVDLARDMIRLCGFEPDVDIPIEFSGSRLGERLNEELTEAEEKLTPAPCDGLLIVGRPQYYEGGEIFERLRELEEIVSRGDASHVRDVLFASIPCYKAEALIGKLDSETSLGKTQP